MTGRWSKLCLLWLQGSDWHVTLQSLHSDQTGRLGEHVGQQRQWFSGGLVSVRTDFLVPLSLPVCLTHLQAQQLP